MITHLLLSPLNYLTIKNLTEKSKIDWSYPLLLALVLVVFLYGSQFLSHGMKIEIESSYFKSSESEKIVGLLQTLPGFYLAALAAVATFNNVKLDAPMAKDDPKPTARRHVLGAWQDVELTRRIYLSLMFSYLTFLSFMLLFAIVLIKYCYTFNFSFISVGFIYWGMFFGAIVFFTFFFQMVLITCLGLSYLGDKMHER